MRGSSRLNLPEWHTLDNPRGFMALMVENQEPVNGLNELLRENGIPRESTRRQRIRRYALPIIYRARGGK